MKAWLSTSSGGRLEEHELPDPEPTGSEVVLAVEHCGLCHSDLHTWIGTTDLGRRGIATRPVLAEPIAMGHEIVGRVVALGPETEGVAIGDRRIVYPWLGCGRCAACASGQDNMCAVEPRSLGFRRHGGFANRVVVPHPRYLVDFEGIDPALASTFACSGLTVLSALRKLPPLPPDEPIVLIGAGGLGLQAIAVLKALGHEAIITIDATAAKREAALAEGASHFVTADAQASAEVVRLAGGKPAAVVDFVNNGETATLAFDLLRKGGTMVQVGLFGGELAVPLPLLTMQVIRIQGSLTGSPQDLADVVALARTGRLKPMPVTRVPKSEINDAMTRLFDGAVTGRLVLCEDMPG